MKNRKKKNKYTKYTNGENIIKFLRTCADLGAEVISVTCSKDFYEVTYLNSCKIKGDSDEV